MKQGSWVLPFLVTLGEEGEPPLLLLLRGSGLALRLELRRSRARLQEGEEEGKDSGILPGLLTMGEETGFWLRLKVKEVAGVVLSFSATRTRQQSVFTQPATSTGGTLWSRCETIICVPASSAGVQKHGGADQLGVHFPGPPGQDEDEDRLQVFTLPLPSSLLVAQVSPWFCVRSLQRLRGVGLWLPGRTSWGPRGGGLCMWQVCWESTSGW